MAANQCRCFKYNLLYKIKTTTTTPIDNISILLNEIQNLKRKEIKDYTL